MIGCYKALAKIGFTDKKNATSTRSPMRRALAFCNSINLSRMFTDHFMNVVTEYKNSDEIEDEFKTDLNVELRHVDGTFNADKRNRCLTWLKDDAGKDVCRVLSNARCLAEGVDVPSLDAVLFMHPRKSQIDVVQSVGRVMRKAEGKKLGYVILPVTVAPGVSPEQTLNNNKKFSVIWQVLNALRAHDERLESTINKIALGEDASDRIEVVGLKPTEKLDPSKAKIDHIRRRKQDRKPKFRGTPDPEQKEHEQLSFTETEISKAIMAKIVEKCGTRDYWENWAHDIAYIAQQHKIRINGLLVNKDSPVWEAFNKFHVEIKDDLNPEITADDAVEMLAQHMITKPVFDTLFQGNHFTEENAVSRALEVTLERLYGANVDSEANTGSLKKFYKSVELRAKGIETAKGRQTLILELYDRFFRKAFPLMTQKLGIVYTPTEIVDFIIHSVENVLNEEFDTSMSQKEVHILDPFAGTGTFITRLLQSGIISNKDMPYKYRNEIHANEIVLLANYISCINIESTYHDIVREDEYQPFNGMVLTDTFQLYEQERDMVADLLPDNSRRRTNQKTQEIKVIIANPPYSVGQKDPSDKAANTTYPNLSERISETYGIRSKGKNLNALHDSYIRAIRWASDRIESDGVVGFICGSGWIDKRFADGMRQCLSEEFDKIYVFDLRGEIRRNMASGSKVEGENVFGSASMTGVAIIILIRNSRYNKERKILYYDIGANLSRKEKLNTIRYLQSINGIATDRSWTEIIPNNNNEWINQGDEAYSQFPCLFSKQKEKELDVFANYSLGVNSCRDKWVVNFSAGKALESSTRLIEYYNSHLLADVHWEDIPSDYTKVKWSTGLMDLYKRGKILSTERQETVTTLTRPFTKAFLVNNHELIERYYRNAHLFPTERHTNLVIAMSGPGSLSGFSVLLSNRILNRSAISPTECFPLNVYNRLPNENGGLLKHRVKNKIYKQDGITDNSMEYYKDFYKFDQFGKEDLFYYIYGLLHSPEYRERFANNLVNELPRIPAVKRFDDFLAFSNAGRELGDLHVNYERVDQHQVLIKEGDLRFLSPDVNLVDHFRVKKMKFGNQNGKQDRSTVIYNQYITMQNIPLEAYDYVVNGKPALKWVMDQQCVETDNKSGITNDANDYANEVMQDPAYPLKLFQRVITVSLDTMRIVRSLPKLDID